MRIYKKEDYRYWKLCYNFVAYNKEFLVTKIYDVKHPLFPSFILNLMHKYKDLINDDYVIYKFYEGMIFQYKKYSEKLWSIYFKGSIAVATKNHNYNEVNKLFDYDAIIESSYVDLSSFLSKAEYEFSQRNESRGAFFIGQYFANKELIKICKHFKNKENEQ